MHKNDKLLFIELTRGNEEESRAAFSEISTRYKKSLYNEAYLKLKNEQDAIDAVQDVHIKLWNRRHMLPANCNLKSYLLACIRNQSVDQLRRKNSFRKYLDALNKMGEPTTSRDLIQEKELQRIVDEVMGSLSEKQRKIIDLCADDLSHREIAERTNSSIQTVRNTISQTLKKLKGSFEKYSKK